MSNFVQEHSAGGVLLQGGKVLLVRAPNLHGELVWTFPKGLIEQGEKAAHAALREVREETGYEASIVKKLEPSVYWYYRDGKRVRKRVEWFLMKPIRQVGEHDWEVAGLAWLPLKEAKKVLKYRSDRILLEQVAEALNENTPTRNRKARP